LGGLPTISYRTLVAQLADDLKAKKPKSVEQVAQKWAALIWAEYSAAFVQELTRIQVLLAMPPFIPGGAPPVPGARTEGEEAELNALVGNLYVGFCIAGYSEPDRAPAAYEVSVMPAANAAPVPRKLGNNAFWGAPNLILRLMNGYDGDLRHGILSSPNWTGTEAELDAVLARNARTSPRPATIARRTSGGCWEIRGTAWKSQARMTRN
jgi:hypothetical protein